MTETLEFAPALSIMRKRWRSIGVLTLIGLALGLGYAFLWPPIWEADAILIPDLKDQETGGLQALVSPNAATPLSIMKGALDSKSAVDAIMKATGLERLQAEKYLDVTPDEHTNQLNISAKDLNRHRALNAVIAAVDTLQAIDARTNKTSAARQASYLQDDIVLKQAQLYAAEKKVADFASNLNVIADPSSSASEFYLEELQKQQYTLYDLNKQLADIKARASHVASHAGTLPTGLPGLDDWRSRAIDLQYQYEALRRNTGDQNPEVLRLKNQLDMANATLKSEQTKYIESIQGSVDKDIAQLEIQRDQAQDSVDYLQRRVHEVPKISLKFKKLAEEAAVLEKVVATLREKYEEARVDAEVAQVKFAELDPPYIQDLPVNRRPFRYGGLGTISGFIFGSFIVVWRDRKHGKSA